MEFPLGGGIAALPAAVPGLPEVDLILCLSEKCGRNRDARQLAKCFTVATSAGHYSVYLLTWSCYTFIIMTIMSQWGQIWDSSPHRSLLHLSTPVYSAVWTVITEMAHILDHD